MPIRQDFIAFQKSIAEELSALEDRIRNLIGPSHWQTDGEHKEEVLRSVLRNHLPEMIRVGRGFICYPPESFFSECFQNDLRVGASGQIDILLTNKESPTLYKQGDLVFVTSEAVKGIIEVKTRVHKGNSNKNSLRSVLNKLANEAEDARKNSTRNNKCWVGLFAYNCGNIDPEYLLKAINLAANGKENRVINFVTLGNSIFVRYWKNGADVDSPKRGPVWHLYKLPKFAPSYFINNYVFELSPFIPNNQQRAWFPIPGTKERRRHSWIRLEGKNVYGF